VEIQTHVYQRVTVVTVTGRVDSASAGDLEVALQHLMEEGKTNFVLDLSGVEFLSSSGLRVLVTTLKAVRKSGGDLRLAALSQRAADAIDLAGLLFSLYIAKLALDITLFVLRSGQSSPTLDISMGWLYAAMPAGFALLGLRYALELAAPQGRHATRAAAFEH